MKKIILLIIAVGICLIFLPQALADLNDGLVAYWPFNGSAIDWSGNGNDGVVWGATLCGDRFGQNVSAYCFDGVDDYINIGNNVKPPFPITVSTWINVSDAHSGYYFSNDYNNHISVRYGLILAVLANNKIACEVYEGMSVAENRVTKVSNDAVVTLGEWHHFTCVFHAHNEIQLFWNGAEVDGTYYGTGSSMKYSNGNGWIGKEHANDYPFNGAIDDIRVYNRALSETEVEELYNLPPIVEPIPDVKANGQDSMVSVSTSDNINVTISIDPGDLAEKLCDWIIFAISSYGIIPLSEFQFPLFELPETSLFDLPLPEGWFVFIFFVDNTPDGSYEYGWIDYVLVVVNPEEGAQSEKFPDFDALIQEKLEEYVGK